MNRVPQGYFNHGVRATTAVATLLVTGYLTVSSAPAEPAAGEGNSEVDVAAVGGTPDDGQDKAKADNLTVVAKTKSDEDADDGGEEGESAHDKTSSKRAKPGKSAFRDDPNYDAHYDSEEQVEIYGGKIAINPPRPLLEVGRQQYTSGIYDESSTALGELNPLLPGLAVYGDWRTAVAFNKNNGKEIAQIATRLNLDVDFKITATERLHAFFTPFQDGATKFTRLEFGGADADGDFTAEFDPEPQTLFFEGDLGSIYSGMSGTHASFDLPFTVGLFPLFLQNGIWANDAILGGAFTLPARNSPFLGLANYDTTFFAAFDNVDNASVLRANGEVDRHGANLYGVTTFIDAFSGYIEAGYGFVDGYDDQNDVKEHFVTAAYSRRYANTVSNATRVFANFGDNNNGNADGLAIISENSLISWLPSTLLPYANFFVGFGNPQPLVDGNNAGILKNIGINFETDALTGYPKLDDTGSNTFGGAIGIEYLFNLDQQIVFEAAMVQPFKADGIGVANAQYGFGMRYQVPINRSWLFRADATYQIQESAEDNFGVRAEVRSKF